MMQNAPNCPTHPRFSHPSESESVSIQQEGPPPLSSDVAVLATMHQKEKAIAPLFAQQLSITVVVPDDFNSDRFGTFTRDVKRLGSQLDAARAKANAVLDLTGETVAIASEGAFFPDPMLPWMAVNRELVLLLDRAQQIEIVGQAVSSQTNFRHKTITSVAEALQFAQEVQFPSHALIVMPDAAAQKGTEIIKGISNQIDLIAAIETTLHSSSHKTAHIETDMRAMHNPTRMGVIAQAAQDLIDTICLQCPRCGCPGFSTTERRPGLPCALCGWPTELTRMAICHCQKCNHIEEIPFPDGVQTADPGQCWHCNP